ncbi:MAG: T9SS type A sorting domain-containing protein [Saprospiraceae bacterium]|nr:T9SS type A sorting domain-containing protein [Saprospiraceae bacterium]
MNLFSTQALIGLMLLLFQGTTPPRQTAQPVKSNRSEHLMPTKEGATSFLSPIVSATKTDALITDMGVVGPSPGDIIEYTVSIFNDGDMEATGIVFNDNLDVYTTLVPGSLICSPVAYPDAYDVLGNVKISVPAASGLLANDQNPCGTGGPLTVTSVNTTGTQGEVSFNPDGSFTFNPAPGFTGTTLFQYIVSNGVLANQGTVVLNVSRRIWFIDNSQPNGDGRLGTPFSSIDNFNSGAVGGSIGDVIFLYRQTAMDYTGAGLTLKTYQAVIGQGASSGIVALTALPVPPFSEALPATGGMNPVIAHNGNTIALANKNQLHGFDISNSGGTGISGSSLDSLIIRDLSVANSAGPALSLANGYLDVIIKKLDASNATTGFLIDNTTGSFTVEGDSNTAGSGGTVQDISERGADIQSATNITLKNMNFTNVNTSNAGSALKIANLHGNCSISNSTFSTPADGLVEIINNASSGAFSLSVNDCTFSDTYSSTHSGQGIYIKTENALVNTVNIDGCEFLRLKGQSVNMSANAGTLNANVTDCTFDKDTQIKMGGVEIRPQGTATVNINTLRNTMILAGGTAVLIEGEDNSVYQARVNNNNITGPGACTDCVLAGSVETVDCNCFGDAITIRSTDNSSGKAEVAQNAINELDYDARGVFANALNEADLNILISNNTINLAGDSRHVIAVVSGPTDATKASSVCANVVNNATSFSGTGPQSFLAHFLVQASNAGSTVNLQGAGITTDAVWNGNGNTPMSPTAVIDSVNTFGIINLGQTCTYTLTHPTALATQEDELVQVGSIPVNSLLSQNNQQSNVAAQTTTQTTGDTDTPTSQALSMMDMVSVGPFNLPPYAGALIIKFRAAINTSIPVGVCQVSNQGVISGDNFASVLTDDPDAGGLQDPTVTLLRIQPSITSCQPNIVVSTDPGECTATVNLNTTAIGCPAPNIIYQIGITPISSTHAFPIGLSTVTVFVSNGVLPNAFCSFKVIVFDNQGPEISCPSGTQTLITNTSNCTYVVQGAELDPPVDGNCQGYTLTNNYTGTSTLAGVTLPAGSFSVTWTAIDNAGLQDVCTVSYQVVDDELSITCPPAITTPCSIADVPPYSSISAFLAAGGDVSDNCGINFASFALQSETGGPVNYVRTYKISDFGGQTTTCTQNVTVNDNVPPVMTAGTIAACYTSVAAAESAALGATTAIDGCPGSVGKMVSTSGTCSAVITVTATDVAGNPASVTYTTRIDNTPPTVTQGTIAACYPSAAAAQAAALAATTATDNCPGALTEIAVVAGTCSAVVTVTTTDQCGNSTVVTYNTRIDNAAPTTTQGTIAACYTTVAAAEAAAIAATTAVDGCPGTVSKTATTTGTCPATIIVTATDQCGNSAQRTYTTKIDTAPPTVTAGSVAACYNSVAAAQAAAVAATIANDNCTGPITKTAVVVGTCSAVITVTASDACGNSASVTYNTRVDITGPTITTGTIAACYPSLSAAQAAALAATTYTDNCPGAVTTSVTSTGSCPTTITVTATDGCGNSSSTSYVTRIDNTPPVISCKNSTVTLNNVGTYTLVAADVLNLGATSDNCGEYTVTMSPSTFTCADRNLTIPVTVTVSDVCGNSSTCTSQITVIEVTTLPFGWTGANIGTNAMGSSSYLPCSQFGTFVLSSKGYTTNLTDVQRVVYQTLCGNSTIIARVTGLSPLQGWAGIQMRESTSQGSRKFTVKTQLSTIIRREARANNFGPTNTLQIGVLLEHTWLRITRNGNTFTAWSSPDGATWTLRNTATFFMAGCLQVGMFVESYNNLATTTATFDNVSVTGNPFPLAGPGVDNTLEEQAKVKIFPNPTSGEVTIDLGELSGKPVQVQIFNTQGQQIETYQFGEALEQERIDLSPYSEGVYWIRVQAEGMAPVTEKIFKGKSTIRP